MFSKIRNLPREKKVIFIFLVIIILYCSFFLPVSKRNRYTAALDGSSGYYATRVSIFDIVTGTHIKEVRSVQISSDLFSMGIVAGTIYLLVKK